MTKNEPARPFDAIRRELEISGMRTSRIAEAEEIRLDVDRGGRTGVPEVIYAEYKTNDQIRESLLRLSASTGRALAARCRSDTLALFEMWREPGTSVAIDPVARTVVATRNGHTPTRTGGRVGVVSAGTSDIPVAREAAAMIREMGAEVVTVNDVGVAGLHRLIAPLEAMIEADVSVVVVVAGMDGALPSVVTGLVSVPVIGLPTSVGYGYGGAGRGALGTMLQTCVPGLVVVNIDNGIGAGAAAALIANRVAAASQKDSDENET
jgi:NCAIR mutase (PurE)-related protein